MSEDERTAEVADWLSEVERIAEVGRLAKRSCERRKLGDRLSEVERTEEVADWLSEVERTEEVGRLAKRS
ncbi:MAG: hypothetical protein IJB67_07765 [Firmicutes bacterium]|nr:hypothetical protein [Bacillota bacterium]